MNAKMNKGQPSTFAQQASFVVLLVIICVISVLFYRVMSSFLLPLFLAALTVVIFKPVDVWILERVKSRKWAAALTTAATAIVIFGPISLGAYLAIEEGRDVVSDPQGWHLDEKLVKLRKTLRLDIPARDQLNRVGDRFDAMVVMEEDEQQAETVAVDVQPGDLAALRKGLQELRDELDKVWKADLSAAQAKAEDPNAAALEHKQARAAVDQMLAELDAYRNQDVGSDGDEEKELRSLLTKLNSDYAGLRATLLGGFPWSVAKELANPNQQKIESWVDYLQSYFGRLTLSLSGRTPLLLARTLLVICIMYLAIFYFFLDGPAMIKTVMRLSPLDDAYETELLSQFDKVSRAVVLATLLSALAQGILAGIGFYLFGVPSVFLLTMLTVILAMVPFVGAAAIWLPACIYLAFVTEPSRVGAAIGLAVYGVLIISMADNVIKPLVLHGQSNLHPLLALLSVLGGVQAMGPIGILVGPMIVAFLQALLNILRKEMFGAEDKPASDST